MMKEAFESEVGKGELFVWAMETKGGCDGG